MNIFWIGNDPVSMAKYLADIHLRKMILEYAQLLSTAHHILDDDTEISGIYKKTHANHPCAKWVRESSQNYQYLYEVFKQCCSEFEQRFGKIHKTSELIDKLSKLPENLPIGVFTQPPLCMPPEFKSNDLLTSYRKYYISKQSAMKMKWTNADSPKWFGVI